MQSPSFRLRDLAAVNVPAALELLDVDFLRTFSRYDGESASDFLDRLHFPEPLGTLRWRSSRAASLRIQTTSPPVSSSRCSTRTFLGSSEGLIFDVPRDDYDSCLWSPLRQYLERLGRGAYHRERRLDAGRGCCGSGWHRRAGRSRALVLATDPATLRRLALESGLGDEAWRDGWRQPQCTAVRGLAAVAGSAGCTDRRGVPGNQRLRAAGQHFGPGTLRGGARRWAAAHGGSVVELHAYALAEQPDEPALKDRLLAELHRVYPERASNHRGGGVAGQ